MTYYGSTAGVHRPIYNPPMPYVGPIDGGVYPGTSIRIKGNIPPIAQRFAVNLQCGPHVSPRDDLVLHINVDFNSNIIIMNSLIGQTWGQQETSSFIPVARGQDFNLFIVCEQNHYKVSLNEQPLPDFTHRIACSRVSHLTIDGDVLVSSIHIESEGSGRVSSAPPVMGFVAPPPLPTVSTYPPQSAGYPATSPYPAASAGMGYPPPMQQSVGYPVGQPMYPQGVAAAYPTSAYPPSGYPPSGYPPSGYPPSAYPPSPQKRGLSGLLGKAEQFLMGGTSAPGYHQHKSKKKGVMGMAAPLAGAAVAGAALKGMSPKKMAKKHKKALKYGIPLAGVGIGGLALAHGMKHKHHGFGFGSSSSSSSSSSEEE